MRMEEEGGGASGGGRKQGGRGNGGEAKAAWTAVEKMATAAAAVVGHSGTEGDDIDGEEGGSSGIQMRKKTTSRGKGGRRSSVDVGEQSEGSDGGRRQGDRRLFLAEEEIGREKEKSGEQRRQNKGKGDLRLRWLSRTTTEEMRDVTGARRGGD